MSALVIVDPGGKSFRVSQPAFPPLAAFAEMRLMRGNASLVIGTRDNQIVVKANGRCFLHDMHLLGISRHGAISLGTLARILRRRNQLRIGDAYSIRYPPAHR